MPSKVSGFPQVAPNNLLNITQTVQGCDLGQRFNGDGGRQYMYVKAGALALVPGSLVQGPIEVASTHFNDMTPSVAAIGATSITVTPGASTGTANQFAGGWLMIQDNTGEGYFYRIASHPAISSSTAFTLVLDDPLVVALDATSLVTLVQNPANGVVITDHSTLQAPLGVAISAIPATDYGFIQVHGPCAVLADNTVTLGQLVVRSDDVDGAVQVAANAETEAFAIVGNALSTGVDTEYVAVSLLL